MRHTDWRHAVAYGTSYSGPFTTHERAQRYAVTRDGARAVTPSRRYLLLVGPGGQRASRRVDSRGLGDWRDRWAVVGTVRPPRRVAS